MFGNYWIRITITAPNDYDMTCYNIAMMGRGGKEKKENSL
jgi:hypothetical protein